MVKSKFIFVNFCHFFLNREGLKKLMDDFWKKVIRLRFRMFLRVQDNFYYQRLFGCIFVSQKQNQPIKVRSSIVFHRTGSRSRYQEQCTRQLIIPNGRRIMKPLLYLSQCISSIGGVIASSTSENLHVSHSLENVGADSGINICICKIHATEGIHSSCHRQAEGIGRTFLCTRWDVN